MPPPPTYLPTYLPASCLSTCMPQVRAFIQNMIGERDELTVLKEDTYIAA